MAGYFYSDDDKDNDEFERETRSVNPRILGGIGIVSGIILLILLMVFISNDTSSGKNNLKNTEMMSEKETPIPSKTAVDVALGNSGVPSSTSADTKDEKVRSEDLDFWDMYDGRHTSIVDNEPVPTPIESEENQEMEVTEPSPSTEPESEYIDGVYLNTIDFSNIKIVDQKMHYYMNGNEVSKIGVEINADSGVVDFNILKENGIQFVMIKVGSRGYDSGVITVDSSFLNNIEAANKCGIDVGLYFCSRAVTENEAIEEADYCINMSAGFKVSYPIAFLFEGEVFEEARTDIMNEDGRTKIVKAFLDEVKKQGKTPIIFGTSQYLLKSIKPEKVLTDYDVFLSDADKVPEYQYQYKMWKYLSNTVVPGVEKTASYVISFVDYSGR